MGREASRHRQLHLHLEQASKRGGILAVHLLQLPQKRTLQSAMSNSKGKNSQGFRAPQPSPATFHQAQAALVKLSKSKENDLKIKNLKNIYEKKSLILLI